MFNPNRRGWCTVQRYQLIFRIFFKIHLFVYSEERAYFPVREEKSDHRLVILDRQKVPTSNVRGSYVKTHCREIAAYLSLHEPTGQVESEVGILVGNISNGKTYIMQKL